MVGVEMVLTDPRRKAGARVASGEFGTMTRGSLAGTATGFRRSTSGLGASAERLALENTAMFFLGVGIASRLDRGGGNASEVTEELLDAEPEYKDSGDVGGKRIAPSPRLYLDLGLVGREREMGAWAEASISIRCGVVPKRAPSFRVERIRRLRC